MAAVTLSLRSGAKVACPECGKPCSIYDRGVAREWRHLDTMQLKTVLRARVPRADCPEHGPQTIRVPWADPMARFSLAFEAHAIDVLENARSTTQACELLKIGWATADRIMARGVARGLERRTLEDLSRVGMDEKSFLKRHRYITASTIWTVTAFLKWPTAGTRRTGEAPRDEPLYHQSHRQGHVAGL